MKGQMTTSGKIMAFTIAAVGAYQLQDRFNSVVSQYGLNPGMINELDVSNYDISDGNPDEGVVSAMSVYHNFSKWYVENRVSLGTSNEAIDAEDIFKRMAGGVMYNAFFGGSNYFHPLNPIDTLPFASAHFSGFSEELAARTPHTIPEWNTDNSLVFAFLLCVFGKSKYVSSMQPHRARNNGRAA